ncbi:uncharacterized protein LOC135812429 [Sycon ciliatum]|uniref:uncharacterized protein LOC135812429 n=1 Tax=Sycon ciliatum TaxID=27933 RepID=UPI0031F62E31
MLVRLLELKLAVMAVLQEDSAHKSLLLKDHQWTLAQEVVDTLGPAATATTLLGGERYCTMSLLLPIVSSLHRAWQRESDADDATLAISSFRARLVEELEDKFSIAAIDALSLPSLSSAIDPRSLLLGYLDSDEDKAAVKLELKRMASSIADLSSMSDDTDCSIEPVAKKPCPSDAMDFFFGADSTSSSKSGDVETEVSTY